MKIEEMMMTKKVDFYFASPNAYLSHRCLVRENSAEINYIPFLLTVLPNFNNKPPMEQFFGVKNKNEYQNIEMQRFIQRHGWIIPNGSHFPVISLQIIKCSGY